MLILFFFISIIILLSTLGFGFIFLKIAGLKNVDDNLGLAGLLGLFLLSIIASYSHIIVPHSYIFNISLIILGILFIFYESIKNKLKIRPLRNLFLIFTALFIALILSKNNEDFPYYHLPNAIQFAQHKLEFGIGNLNHGFKHISSLFMLMSLNYLPIIEHYLFNLTNFLFYVFFIVFSVFEIYRKKEKNSNFANIILSFLLILFLVKFSRLAEFGSDISGQIILSVYIFFIIEFIFNKNLKFSDKELYLKLSLIFLVFASTLKFILIIYCLPLLYLIFITKNKKEYIFKILEPKFIIFLIIPAIFFILFNFTSTGCLLYPVAKTCFTSLDWSLSYDTVKNLNLHYETWAKGGKGPNFEIENPSDYVNSLNWIQNWFSVYFFNKFSDYILVIISILIFVSAIYPKEIFKNKPSNIKKDNSFLYFYIFLILIFIVWFLNFPTLRYAGYLITFLLIALPFAKFLDERVRFKTKVSLRKISILILISYSIFLFKNSNRLIDEFSKSYNDHHNFKNFPFYWVEDVKYNKIIIDGLDVYKVNSKCWDVPAPCIRYVNNLNININKGYIFYSRKK